MIWKLLRCIIFQVTNRRHISHISADYVGLKYSQQLQVNDKLNLKLWKLVMKAQQIGHCSHQKSTTERYMYF